MGRIAVADLPARSFTQAMATRDGVTPISLAPQGSFQRPDQSPTAIALGPSHATVRGGTERTFILK